MTWISSETGKRTFKSGTLWLSCRIRHNQVGGSVQNWEAKKNGPSTSITHMRTNVKHFATVPHSTKKIQMAGAGLHHSPKHQHQKSNTAFLMLPNLGSAQEASCQVWNVSGTRHKFPPVLDVEVNDLII